MACRYMHDMPALIATSGSSPPARHAGHDGACNHAHAGHGDADEIELAERHCRAHGLRLTPQRRAVLEALIQARKPLGAYDLIESLRPPDARGPAPIIIYRALDFLKEHGFIHRLESLNAFVACPHRHDPAARVVFLICEACRSVEEAVTAPLDAALTDLAKAHGFAPRRQIVELAGTCRACSEFGITEARAT